MVQKAAFCTSQDVCSSQEPYTSCTGALLSVARSVSVSQHDT